MSTIANALSWGGSEVTMSMFTVSGPDNADALDLSYVEPVPISIRRYDLEDEGSVLGGLVACEYDLVFGKVPSDIESVIRQCFDAAHAAGVRVAWFGFEGSFNFEFLLTKEIANQVYAVLDSQGSSIASDDELVSEGWALRVVDAGLEARRRSDR